MAEHESCNNKFKNRIEIFRHLTVDEIKNEINEIVFDNLLGAHYNEFVEFCEKIKAHANEISTVSCYIENGELNFEITYL